MSLSLCIRNLTVRRRDRDIRCPDIALEAGGSLAPTPQVRAMVGQTV